MSGICLRIMTDCFANPSYALRVGIGDRDHITAPVVLGFGAMAVGVDHRRAPIHGVVFVGGGVAQDADGKTQPVFATD